MMRYYLLLLVVAFSSGLPAWGDEIQSEANKPASADLKFQTKSIRGEVVWLNEALKRRYGVSTTEDAKQRVLALETVTGELLPLMEDLRGRSFRKDQRLRGKPMELLVRHYQKHPMLRVLRVYQFHKKAKYEVDYWCDVCAIPMVETGFCDCCQDTNRLRKRRVKNGVTLQQEIKEGSTSTTATVHLGEE